MGRVSIIKSHKHKKAIENAVLRGVSVRSIAARYGFSEAALRRYRNKYMTDSLRKAQEKDLDLRADNLQETVRTLFKDAQEFFAAAKADLIDPETGKVTWIPHASDVQVIYYIQIEGSKKRRKENLQVLIDQIMKESKSTFGSFKWKYADARKEAEHYIDQSRRLVETLAKLTGEMQTEGTALIVNKTILVGIKEVIIDATKGHPKIRRQIVERLKSIEESETVA